MLHDLLWAKAVKETQWREGIISARRVSLLSFSPIKATVWVFIHVVFCRAGFCPDTHVAMYCMLRIIVIFINIYPSSPSLFIFVWSME